MICVNSRSVANWQLNTFLFYFPWIRVRLSLNVSSISPCISLDKNGFDSRDIDGLLKKKQEFIIIAFSKIKIFQEKSL